MKQTIVLIVAFSAMLSAASALDFPEQNFSIDLPADWSQISPAPPQTVIATHSPDQAKILLVIASKIPKNENTTALRDFRAGARKSMIDQGVQIDSEGTTAIDGLLFETTKGRIPAGGTLVSYSTGAGNTIYMLQTLYRGGGADTDQELRSIVTSFRLLKPATALPSADPPRSAAYAAGYLTVTIAFWLLIIFLLYRGGRAIFKRRKH